MVMSALESLFSCFLDYCVSLLDQILQVVNQNIGELHFCSPNRIVPLLSKSVAVLVDYKGLHCDLELFGILFLWISLTRESRWLLAQSNLSVFFKKMSLNRFISF